MAPQKRRKKKKSHLQEDIILGIICCPINTLERCCQCITGNGCGSSDDGGYDSDLPPAGRMVRDATIRRWQQERRVNIPGAPGMPIPGGGGRVRGGMGRGGHFGGARGGVGGLDGGRRGGMGRGGMGAPMGGARQGMGEGGGMGGGRIGGARRGMGGPIGERMGGMGGERMGGMHRERPAGGVRRGDMGRPRGEGERVAKREPARDPAPPLQEDEMEWNDMAGWDGDVEDGVGDNDLGGRQGDPNRAPGGERALPHGHRQQRREPEVDDIPRDADGFGNVTPSDSD